ncbi:hypothetical protein [Chitinimonas naiadis]
MSWKRASDHSITRDGWTICRVSPATTAAFWLFAPRGKDNLPDLRGTFDTADQAKAEFDRLNPNSPHAIAQEGNP